MLPEDKEVVVKEGNIVFGIKEVSSAIAITVVACGVWFGGQAKLTEHEAEANARMAITDARLASEVARIDGQISSNKSRMDRQMIILCSIAKKLGINSADCPQ